MGISKRHHYETRYQETHHYKIASIEAVYVCN